MNRSESTSPSDRKAAGRWARWVVLALLALICLFLLFSQTPPRELGETFRHIAWPVAAAGLGAAILSYLLKALRYRIILGADATFGRTFGVTVAQNVIAQFIPARAGDVGYVYLVKQAGLGSYGAGLASLLLCRFIDLVVLWVMYVGSLGGLHLEWVAFRWAAIVLGVGLVLAVAIFAVALFARQHLAGFIEGALDRARLTRIRAIKAAWETLRQAGACAARELPSFKIVAVVAVSVAIWTMSTFWNWLVWCAVGTRLGLGQIVFMTSLSYLLGLLPVFVFGGIGTADAIHAGVLVAFGIAAGPAAAFSLCNRALSTIYQAMLVLIAVPMWRPTPR